MLGGIFTTFKKPGGLANFIPFKNSLESIYAIFNKLFGGNTYVDLSTTQLVTTPIISNGNIDVSIAAPITSPYQILNGVASSDFPEISEIDLKRLDSSLPGITPGSIAWGGLSGIDAPTNYISNPNAESGITSWTLYNNGAFSVPVSGSGGTPSGVSFSANSTNPIQNTKDFNLAYQGASNIGQGVSTDLTISNSSSGLGFKIKFLYRTSQNYKTGNVRIFLLDSSSNTSIPLSNNIIKKSIGIAEFEADFIHSGSTSLRLCFHIADSNPNDFNLFFDSVQLSEIESAATLYYYTSVSNGSTATQTYQPAKLGWPHGDGIYNNNSTFSQKYSGWCHGSGNYKIITSSDYVDIVFDHLKVQNLYTASKDVVYGQLTSPVSYFNIRIVAGSVGLNSIDTGTLSTDTGYYVYFIYNPTTLQYGATLSKSRVAPFMPEGYTYYERIGWIRSASSSGFFPSLQINDKFIFLQQPPVQTAFTTTSAGQSSSASISIVSSTVEDPANHPHRSLLTSVDMKCISTFPTATSSYRQLAPINTAYFATPYNFVPYSAILAGTVADDVGDMWYDVSLSQGSTPNYGLSLLVNNTNAVETTFKIYITGFTLKNIFV